MALEENGVGSSNAVDAISADAIDASAPCLSPDFVEATGGVSYVVAVYHAAQRSGVNFADLREPGKGPKHVKDKFDDLQESIAKQLNFDSLDVAIAIREIIAIG